MVASDITQELGARTAAIQGFAHDEAFTSRMNTPSLEHLGSDRIDIVGTYARYACLAGFPHRPDQITTDVT